MVTVQHPFPDYAWPRVWAWIQTYRRLFLDDNGPKSVDDFVAFMASQPFTFCALRDGEIVGAIWFDVQRPDSGVIHVAFKRDAWGNGVPDAALRQIVAQIFSTGKCRKIVSIFFAHNRYARGVAQRFGSQRDGILREEAMVDGKPVDMEIWSLLKSDYDRRELVKGSHEHNENNDQHADILSGPIEHTEPISGDSIDQPGKRGNDSGAASAGIGGSGPSQQQLRGPEPAAPDKPQRKRIRNVRKSSNGPKKPRRLAD